MVVMFSAWLSPRCVAQDCDDDSTLVGWLGVPGPNRVYADANALPNGVNYLPAPPDTTAAKFIDYFAQWQWGKDVRPTNRGAQASRESQYGLNRLVIIMSQVLKVSMTGTRTPKMITLIYQVGETGSKSTQKAKLNYQRRRPFEQMGEHTWGMYDDEDELRGNGAYPSAHSAFGWAVGLVLAEMFPNFQDTILSRAFQYGESRVIVGAHWQSDVEAARLTAAAAVAHMHRSPQFLTDFEAARQEYYTVRGISPFDVSDVGLPDGKRFLEQPINESSPRFFADIAQYWQAKTERDGERGAQAIDDAACTTPESLLETFGTATGERYTEELRPALYDVVRLSQSALVEAAEQLSAQSPVRPRPFVRVGEPPLMTTDSATTAASCYPSVDATVAWGVALLLAEIMPEHQEAVLKRGHEMGRSREIAGYAYASDVQAGRALASAVVARLHAMPEFALVLANACTEHDTDPLVTPVQDLLEQSAAFPDGWFSITGQQLGEEPTEKGIYIHAGQKVVK